MISTRPICRSLQRLHLCNKQRLYATNAEQDKTTSFTDVATSTENVLNRSQKKVNKAMLHYLERARQRDLFLDKEKAEFDIGKRHLANMMGVDVNSLGQKEIDQAITYLFPSGLTQKDARPMMKPPEELWARHKAAEFDETGRPFHAFFYTQQPNFYQLLHKLFAKYQKLDRFAERQSTREPPETLTTGSTEWLTLEELGEKLVEKITEQQYQQFVAMSEHFIDHPYAYLEQEFIMSLRKDTAVGQAANLHAYTGQVLTDPETGRQFVEAEGKRKSLMVKARVYAVGSGKFLVDGHPLNKFEGISPREQCVAPLLLLERPFEFDVEAWQTHGPQRDGKRSMNCLAGAVRLAVARALCPFVSPKEVEMLRLAGLLNWDVRRRERKKYGKKKARKGRKWRPR